MTKKTIMIVDDTKIICLGLEAELSDEGYNVIIAYTGKQAVEKAKENKIDLVYTDLMMPEMNGVGVCKGIKEISPGTQVVLMSGHPGELEKEKEGFLKAGGRDEFLRKPFMEGEIVEITKKIFEKN